MMTTNNSVTSNKSFFKTNTPLREFRVVLPETYPDGEPARELHAGFEDEVLLNFGFTYTTPGSFLYYTTSVESGDDADENVDPGATGTKIPFTISDDCLVYHVPMENNKLKINQLIELVKDAGRELELDFVYIVLPTGESLFIETDSNNDDDDYKRDKSNSRQ